MTECTIRIQAVLLALAILPAINAGAQTPVPAGAAARTAGDAGLAAKLEALTRKMEARDQAMEAQNQAMEAQKKELDQLRAQVVTGSSGPTPMSQREREELAKMIHEELEKSGALQAKLPAWLDGLKFVGDVRVRYEGQFFDGTTQGKKTPWDYNRARFRVRFGFIKEIDEEWSAGFRLATGNTSDPWQTNQTMTGDFTRKPIQVDQAWIQDRPKWADKELTVVAGKFANPFVTSDLLWDPDIMPEGVAESWTHKCCENFTVFATLAQLFLQDNANTDGVTLLAYQLGIRYKLTPRAALTMAAAYYQYINVDQDTQLASYKKGNSVTTGSFPPDDNLPNKATYFSTLGKQDFQIMDLYSDLTFLLGQKKLPLKFFGQVDWNMDNAAPSPYANERLAFLAGVALGQIKKQGDWEISYNYRRVEANAVVAAFSDDAFGGVDRQGHSLAVRYALRDNLVFGFRYIAYDWIVNSVDPGRNLIRAELELKF